MTAEQDAAASSTEPVRYVTESGVATITLNRPEAMNSLDVATKEQLRDSVLAAAADEGVRCVVLRGSGRAFCVGQDLKEHAALLDSGPDDALAGTVAEHYNPTVTALLTMSKPVLAAVNGVAAGAGASLALACDLRVMADTGSLNFAFAGVALSCDTAMSWTLPRIVGRAKALELLYFPRTLRAEECLQLGLATRVVPAAELAEATAELAGRLAAGPTLAYAALREAVLASAGSDLETALEHERELMQRTGSTSDHRAAVTAFMAKQPPVFEGH